MATFNKRDFIAKQAHVIFDAEKKGDAAAFDGLVKGYSTMADAVHRKAIDTGDDAKRFAFALHAERKAVGNVDRKEPSPGDISRLRNVLAIGRKTWHAEWFANVAKLNSKTPVSDTIMKRIAKQTTDEWKDATHAPSVEWLAKARAKWLKKSHGDSSTPKPVNPETAAEQAVVALRKLVKLGAKNPAMADAHELYVTALRSAEAGQKKIAANVKAIKAAKAKADAAAKAEKEKGE